MKASDLIAVLQGLDQDREVMVDVDCCDLRAVTGAGEQIALSINPDSAANCISQMSSNVLNRAIADLRRNVPGFDNLDDVRKTILIDMCFNLGISRLLKFQKMWNAIDREDWDDASMEMLDSRWARQVGQRAVFLSNQMQEGR